MSLNRSTVAGQKENRNWLRIAMIKKKPPLSWIMQRDDQQPSISWHNMTFPEYRFITQFYRPCRHFLKTCGHDEFMRIQCCPLTVQLSGRNLNCLFAFHSSLFYLKIMTNIFLSSHFEHSSSLLVTFLLSNVWRKVNNESLHKYISQPLIGHCLSNGGLWLAVALHHLLPPDRISVWRYQHLISPWQ